MPNPVRVKKPSLAHSPSWVSMLRGLTCSSRASSWPLQSRGGWLRDDVWFRHRSTQDLADWFRLLPALLPTVLDELRRKLG